MRRGSATNVAIRVPARSTGEGDPRNDLPAGSGWSRGCRSCGDLYFLPGPGGGESASAARGCAAAHLRLLPGAARSPPGASSNPAGSVPSPGPGAVTRDLARETHRLARRLQTRAVEDFKDGIEDRAFARRYVPDSKKAGESRIFENGAIRTAIRRCAESGTDDRDSKATANRRIARVAWGDSVTAEILDGLAASAASPDGAVSRAGPLGPEQERRRAGDPNRPEFIHSRVSSPAGRIRKRGACP